MVRFSTHTVSGNFVPEYYNNRTSSSTADPVTVTAGQNTTGIDAQLEPGGSISGRVTNNSGVGIADVGVSAIVDPSSLDAGYANTDSDGNYTIKGLYSGNFRV
jgi:hypothetical protein